MSRIGLFNQSHLKTEKIQVSEGQIFIKKSKNTAFVTPSFSSNDIDKPILDEWIKDNATSDEWAQRFRLASESKRKVGFVTEEDLKSQAKATQQAKAFQSPSKLKMEEVHEATPTRIYQSSMPDKISSKNTLLSL